MQERSWSDLAGDTDSGDTNVSSAPGANPKRQRRPKGTVKEVAITKGTIVDILSLANMPIQFSGYGAYALNAAEIDELASAWLKVIKQNPGVAKYLVMGEKLGVWGNLLFVHAKLIGSRMELFTAQQNATRSTRPNGRPERNRKDDTGTTATLLA